QAGKSTLTRLASAGRSGTVIRLLDDPATLRAATDDPTGFVDHDGLMVIDEIQLVPELLRPIKVKVDLDPTPGQFLLTGSSRVLALRTLPDALPGRMEVIELWPFSQGEISGEPDLLPRPTVAGGRRYPPSKAFQPGPPDKPTEPSARPNWPSSTRGSPVISLARTPVGSASREARPDR